jgi:hypothetical protein
MAPPSEMPAAAPLPPPGLAGYQEGAVVSRALVKPFTCSSVRD